MLRPGERGADPERRQRSMSQIRRSKRTNMSMQWIIPAACIRVSRFIARSHGQAAYNHEASQRSICAQHSSSNVARTCRRVMLSRLRVGERSQHHDVPLRASCSCISWTRSVELRVEAQSTEVANAVEKHLNPTRDIVFVRVYTKFVAGYNVSGSEHNGITISSQYCCPGVPANGTNKFLVHARKKQPRSREC